MVFDKHPQREAMERQKIASMADAAMKYADMLDLERKPDNHIWKALDQEGIKNRSDRSYFFRQVSAELKRRGFKTPQQKQKIRDARTNQLMKEAREALIMADAAAHERRIDPHEFDREEED